MEKKLGGSSGYCQPCSPPLVYNGGPVMGSAENTPGTITITPIYWVPTGYSIPSDYKTIINKYISDAVAASGQPSNPFSVLTQYYFQATPSSPPQNLTYSISATSAVTDTADFPSSGCPVDGTNGYLTCISDGQLQTELMNDLTNLGLPQGDSYIYPVFFPENVETCFDTSGFDCSDTSYCGYHSWFEPSSLPIIYANMPFASQSGCAVREESPNGDVSADTMISILTHETSEAMTDWNYYSGWADPTQNEISDECAYVYGKSLGSTNVPSPFGSMYDQLVNGDKYWIQSNFSNLDFAHGVGEIINPADPSTYVPGCVRQTSLAVATPSLPDGDVAQGYSASLVATGGVYPYTWSVTSGALPGGLTLDPNAGVISGSPTSVETSNFTVQAVDSTTPTPETISEPLSITIGSNGTLVITTTSLPDATTGARYSQPVNAVGGNPPYTWKLARGSGKLPKGLKLNKSTGIISGTPKRSGSSTFAVEVLDKKTKTRPHTQNTATAVLTITVS